jgi:AmmeMemoRadiSam system protein A
MGKIFGYYAMPHPPIVIPEVGRGEEKKIKDTSEACFRIADEIAGIQPDTIIIITPHGPLFSDAISLSFENNINGSLEGFRAPEVKFNMDIDLQLTGRIIDSAQAEGIPTINITKTSAKHYGIKYELDHGVMVPLYFINRQYKGYKIVHITYGMLPKLQLYRFGVCIKKAVEESNCNAVLIASGDLSHRLSKEGPYEYSEYGEKFDREIISLLCNGDVPGVFNMDINTINNAGECAMRSYYIMLGAMDGYDIKSSLMSYEGTFGVGYGVMKFSCTEKDVDTLARLIQENENKLRGKIESEDPYVRLARESLTYYLIHGKYMNVPSYVENEMLEKRRGVFVSIKKDGNLRGCIGTFLPTTDSVAQEIIRNAVAAGLHDPRFHGIELDELPELDFSVDVLTEPEKASREELNPQKYGVIVRSGHSTGLLLPDLEGVDTVEEQLAIALQKAGIPRNKNYTIERFEVVRHSSQTK